MKIIWRSPAPCRIIQWTFSDLTSKDLPLILSDYDPKGKPNGQISLTMSKINFQIFHRRNVTALHSDTLLKNPSRSTVGAVIVRSTLRTLNNVARAFQHLHPREAKAVNYIVSTTFRSSSHPIRGSSQGCDLRPANTCPRPYRERYEVLQQLPQIGRHPPVWIELGRGFEGSLVSHDAARRHADNCLVKCESSNRSDKITPDSFSYTYSFGNILTLTVFPPSA